MFNLLYVIGGWDYEADEAVGGGQTLGRFPDFTSAARAYIRALDDDSLEGGELVITDPAHARVRNPMVRYHFEGVGSHARAN